MSRCELTGKSPVVKNLVSHSNIKTKSIAQPNIQQKRIFSKTLNVMVSLKMSTHAIRSIEHKGGFDTFILQQDNEILSQKALEVKRRIQRKITRNNKKTTKA